MENNNINMFFCEIEVTTTNRVSIALHTEVNMVTVRANSIKELNKTIKQYIKKHNVEKFENGTLMHCVHCQVFRKYHAVPIN